MTTLEKAEALRTEAINLLLEERARIDQQLQTLGYEKAPLGKKRGRPPKQPILAGPSDHSCTTEKSDSSPLS